MTRDDDGFVGHLRQQARKRPDATFARFDGVALTFSEIDRRAAAFAAHLRGQGISPGERVAVMMRNSVAAISVVFGLAKAGIVWVPINVQQRGAGLAYLLSHSTPRLLVVDAEFAAVAAAAAPADTPARLVHDLAGALERALDAGAPFDEPSPPPDAPAAIMYTSGTTGPPKGVTVSHRMLRLAAEGVCLVSGIRPGDVMFVWEPLSHIGGAQLLVVPLLRDVTLAMVGRFSAGRFWRQVGEAGASHVHYLGGILQMLLNQPPADDDRTHGARIAWGGGCPPRIWAEVERRFGVELRECYGMTEASSITTFNGLGLVGSVGRPLPWFGVKLLDGDGSPVPAGQRGEIVVEPREPGAIFSAYFNNPEATAAALRGGALHTGDIGSYDQDGNLFFHGRLTENVRCRGENVSAWEVEHVAIQHECVDDCAMIGVEAEVGEQEIKLFVTPKPGCSIDPASLSAWLGLRLAPYQNPRFIAVVGAFERTASHRVVKHKLPAGREGCWDRAAATGRP